ncbi:MAG: hypothetical protein JSU01_14540 [Bacteroidetes bacterium]|nr:hypothetical protein [Bacteroidota bacterium]
MEVEYTMDMAFGFEGPNLCFLGTEDDFKKLAVITLDLTNTLAEIEINLSQFDFLKHSTLKKEVILSSKTGGNSLAKLKRDQILFELDHRYWERLFKYFVLMSWDQKTYYLNSYENCLDDFDLDQDCNFICSSEFPKF